MLDRSCQREKQACVEDRDGSSTSTTTNNNGMLEEGAGREQEGKGSKERDGQGRVP
jgi:hypothetical protein